MYLSALAKIAHVTGTHVRVRYVSMYVYVYVLLCFEIQNGELWIYYSRRVKLLDYHLW